MRREIRNHFSLISDMGCMVTTVRPATVHHCHSGSVTDVFGHGLRGVGQKVSDWLVIPLVLELHSVGPDAIDGDCGVRTWEARFGTQVSMLVKLNRCLPYNIFERAGLPDPSDWYEEEIAKAEQARDAFAACRLP